MNSGPSDPNPVPTGRERRRRLDVLLTERDLAASRTEARGLVMAGRVRVDGAVIDKPGRHVPTEARIEIEYPSHRYVSRGGVKLEKALDFFGLDVSGLVCLDVGASTGGFTDCLLQRGAKRVYAVDVGYGLLAWSLRTDPRVVALDRINARYLDRESFHGAVKAALQQGPGPALAPDRAQGLGTAQGPPDAAGFEWPTFATCDVSFISLLKVVPAVVRLLESPWQMVLLVKPQFEAGREKVGARGVVRDPEVHVEVLRRTIAGVEGLVAGLTYSPVCGPEGNIEYLLWVREAGPRPEPKGGGPNPPRPAVRRVVGEAFASVPEA